MNGPYAATPLLRRLSAGNGWSHEVIHDAHGRLEAVTFVRVGPVWTDSVAIAGEDQTLAMRHRTRESDLIVPAELPSESRAVWQRHGRCADVLAELFELPDPARLEPPGDRTSVVGYASAIMFCGLGQSRVAFGRIWSRAASSASCSSTTGIGLRRCSPASRTCRCTR